MSRVEKVELIDDLDGGPAEYTVNFGLDGHVYVIDLNGRNAGALRKTLSVYTGHARKITGRASGKPAGRSTESRHYSAEVREWAKATGRFVSDRGRIPVQVLSEYEAAQTNHSVAAVATKFVEPGAGNVTVTRNGPAATRAAKSGQTVGRARAPRTAPGPGDSPRGRERKGRSASPANVTRRAARGPRRGRE